MREDIIRKTEKFLWENLMKSVNFEGNSQRSVEYRFEHSWRVANIGREIAEREGFDVERMFVACLLHDVGYSVEMKDENDYKNHGRYGARIARPFLLEHYVKGRTVLDCFSNVGGFSLCASKYGATEVTTVDVSADAVQAVRRNAERNGFTNITAIRSELVPKANAKDNSKTLGILGIIFAFLLPPITFFVSGIGLSKASQYHNKKAEKLNNIALIIAVITTILGLILYRNY